MQKQKIQLKVSDDDNEMAYLYLPAHPKKAVAGLVKNQVRLASLIKGYQGADIYLDFDKSGTLVGIEIT